MTSSGLGSQGPLAPSKSAAGVAHKGLDNAIERCQKYLLDNQYQDGYWWGELEANVAITSEYLMLTHFFDITRISRARSSDTSGANVRSGTSGTEQKWHVPPPW